VFFGLLAMFPAVTALVSSYGLFTDAQTIGEHLSFLSSVLPAGAFQIVQDQINRVVEKGSTKLGFGFLFGLALALWSANAGMKAIIDALNVIYDEEEKRGFIKLNLVSLALTLGGLVAVLLAVASIVVFPLVMTRFGLGALTEIIATILRWPILLLMVMFGLAVLYRYGPSRREPKWEWISVGSVLATLLWIAGSGALSYYLSNFGNYDATYGSLGAAIGLMTWMWMSSIVILFGAELNSEIEHQTARDTTEGGEKPLGARGAAMADTVGKAQA
jgi:membrane protein